MPNFVCSVVKTLNIIAFRRELLSRFGKATDPKIAERTGRTMMTSSPEELKIAEALVDRAAG